MHSVSDGQLEVYRQSMQRRKMTRAVALSRRVAKAQDISRRAARWLQLEYKVGPVWLFGSLLQPQWFTMTSDIDLAITQLPPADYLMAVALLQDISPGFKIDLVQLEHIPDDFRAVILAKGKSL